MWKGSEEEKEGEKSFSRFFSFDSRALDMTLAVAENDKESEGFKALQNWVGEAGRTCMSPRSNK